MQTLVVNSKPYVEYLDVSGTGDPMQTYAIGPKAKETIDIPSDRYKSVIADHQNKFTFKQLGGTK